MQISDGSMWQERALQHNLKEHKTRLMEFLFELEMLGRIAVAMALGALIGLERELADKPAGVRTHMLLAGAATLFVPLGELLVAHFSKEFGSPPVRADPIVLIQAIVTGVAFLGAGTIIRRGSESAVHGLTTAASLLFTAGIGVCVGLKEFVLAIGATALALLTLVVVRVIEGRVKSKPHTGSKKHRPD